MLAADRLLKRGQALCSKLMPVRKPPVAALMYNVHCSGRGICTKSASCFIEIGRYTHKQTRSKHLFLGRSPLSWLVAKPRAALQACGELQILHHERAWQRLLSHENQNTRSCGIGSPLEVHDGCYAKA